MTMTTRIQTTTSITTTTTIQTTTSISMTTMIQITAAITTTTTMAQETNQENKVMKKASLFEYCFRVTVYYNYNYLGQITLIRT